MEVPPKVAAGVIAMVVVLCAVAGFFFFRQDTSIPPAQRAMFEAEAKKNMAATKNMGKGGAMPRPGGSQNNRRQDSSVNNKARGGSQNKSRAVSQGTAR